MCGADRHLLTNCSHYNYHILCSFLFFQGSNLTFGSSTAPSIFGGQVASPPESVGQQASKFNFTGPPLQAKGANGSAATSILATSKTEFNFIPPPTTSNVVSTASETKSIFGAPSQPLVKFSFVGSSGQSLAGSATVTQAAASTAGFNFTPGKFGKLMDIRFCETVFMTSV